MQSEGEGIVRSISDPPAAGPVPVTDLDDLVMTSRLPLCDEKRALTPKGSDFWSHSF